MSHPIWQCYIIFIHDLPNMRTALYYIMELENVDSIICLYCHIGLYLLHYIVNVHTGNYNKQQGDCSSKQRKCILLHCIKHVGTVTQPKFVNYFFINYLLRA